MKYQALLFDVDGVLVESERARFNYFQQAVARKGLFLSDDSFYQMVGKTSPVFFQELITKHQFDEKMANEIIYEYISSFKPNYVQNVAPISETVDFIHGYTGKSKIGVATMNPREITIKLLHHLNIDHIVKAVITRDDVINQKPNPEAYLKLAQLLEENPGDCAVIEDSITGVKAGIDAGMDSYIFLNSYNSREQFSNINICGYISSLTDLTQISL